MATRRNFAIVQSGVNPDIGRYAPGDVYTSLNAADVATRAQSLVTLDEQWFWEIWGDSVSGVFPLNARLGMNVVCDHTLNNFLTICGAPGNEYVYPLVGKATIDLPGMTLTRLGNAATWVVWQDLRVNLDGGLLHSSDAVGSQQHWNRVYLVIPTSGNLLQENEGWWNSIIHFKDVQNTGTTVFGQLLSNTSVLLESVTAASIRGIYNGTLNNSMVYCVPPGDAVFDLTPSGSYNATDDTSSNKPPLTNGIENITATEFINGDLTDLTLAGTSQLIDAGVAITYPVADFDKDVARQPYVGSWPMGASLGVASPPEQNYLGMGRPV